MPWHIQIAHGLSQFQSQPCSTHMTGNCYWHHWKFKSFPKLFTEELNQMHFSSPQQMHRGHCFDDVFTQSLFVRIWPSANNIEQLDHKYWTVSTSKFTTRMCMEKRPFASSQFHLLWVLLGVHISAQYYIPTNLNRLIRQLQMSISGLEGGVCMLR